MPYNTTEQERELAMRVGIPMYGADPKTFHLGTKSGARKVFGEEGVSYPLGIEDLHSADECRQRDHHDAEAEADDQASRRQTE